MSAHSDQDPKQHERFDELLDLAFDCHDDPQALLAEIQSDSELRELWTEAQGMASTLLAASHDAAGEDARAPVGSTPSIATRGVSAVGDASKQQKRADWWLRGLLAAAALVLAVPAGLWGLRALELSREEARNIDLVLSGPRNVPARGVAQFTATARDLSGKPIDAVIEWALRDASGARHVEGKAAAKDGAATIQLAAMQTMKAAEKGAREIYVRVTGEDGSVREAQLPLVIGEAPPLVHLSLDKAAYRPGEVVRVRAAVLERASLAARPRAGMAYLRITSPLGQKTDRGVRIDEKGVLACDYQLPSTVAEGNWQVGIYDRSKTMLLATRALPVLRFQAPKLAKKITLDRESYAPGQKGSAEVHVARNGADGAAAAGAAIEAELVLDGTKVWSAAGKLDAAGRASFSFEVPERVARGAARFVAKIRDGGVVETEIEAFVVPIGTREVAFYPESGVFAAGVETRVYVEVRDMQGRPLSSRGRVVDGSGRTVVPFRTEHQGRGRFALTAKLGERYKLLLEDDERSASKVQGFDLPEPKEARVVFEALGDAVAKGEPARFRVTTIDDGPWLLGVFARGMLVGQASFRDAKGAEIQVEVPEHAAGVLRATIFDARMQPVAERLIRRASARRLDVAITPSKKVVAPGTKQSVRIAVRDEHGDPVRAMLGVTVHDKSVRDMIGEHRVGIEDEAWLCADVEELEDVEDFVVAGPDADRNVDLLLGTRGWRRFAWAKPDAIAKLRKEHGVKVERLRAQEARPFKPALAQSMHEMRTLRRDARDARDYTRVGGMLAFVLLLFVGLPLLVTRKGLWRTRLVGIAAGCACLAITLWALNSQLGAGMADSAAPGAFVAESAAGADSTLRASGIAKRGVPVRDSEDALSVVDLNGFGQGDSSRSWFNPRSWGDSISVPPSAPGMPLDDVDAFGRDFAGLPARDPEFQLERRSSSRGGAYRGPGDELPPSRVNGIYVRVHAAPYIHKSSPASTRRDFAETLYWNPRLSSGDDGVASFDFDVSHKLTTWAIHIDGHGTGRIGQAEARFDSRLPLEVDLKMPVAATHGDALEVPVLVQLDPAMLGLDSMLGTAVSVRPEAITMRVRLDGKALPASTDTLRLSDLKASGTRRGAFRSRALLRVSDALAPGVHRIEVRATYADFTDSIVRELVVLPRGFPISGEVSGVLADKRELRVAVPESVLPKTLRAEVRALPSPLATLLGGLQGMIREPHGCFEQVSSTTYPNILAMQLLQNVDTEAPSILRDARGKIARGYQKLAGYECDGGGFDWWGKGPASLGLTAYGLLEFADMARVHDVDRAMLERTRAFLLAQRDGTGFRQSGSKRFGRAAKATVDAYVCWALLSAGTKAADLAAQLGALAKGVEATEDGYELALRALVLEQAGRERAAAKARSVLAARQRVDGGVEGMQTLTRSGARDRVVETTSLALLAWVGLDEYAAQTEKAMRFLRSQRRGSGSFGGTQATVLALKAACAYALEHRHKCEAGQLRVFVEDKLVETRSFMASAWRPIVISGLESVLRAGENALRLELTGGNRFPFTVAWSYRDAQPRSAGKAPIALRATLANEEVEEGKTVALELRLRNRLDEAVHNPIALLGIPAGLEAPKRVLDDLVAAGSIAQWERHGRMLVLYWRGIDRRSDLEFEIDLLARTPGLSRGQASSVYPYYSGDEKAWAAPLEIRVR